jgi:hypothetical protein
MLKNVLMIHLKNIQVNNSPSNSLKERDWEALEELFDREDCDEIEADIKTNLLLLYPEPFWEDGGFEFFGDYI